MSELMGGIIATVVGVLLTLIISISSSRRKKRADSRAAALGLISALENMMVELTDAKKRLDIILSNENEWTVSNYFDFGDAIDDVSVIDVSGPYGSLALQFMHETDLYAALIGIPSLLVLMKNNSRKSMADLQGFFENELNVKGRYAILEALQNHTRQRAAIERALPQIRTSCKELGNVINGIEDLAKILKAR